MVQAITVLTVLKMLTNGKRFIFNIYTYKYIYTCYSRVVCTSTLFASRIFRNPTSIAFFGFRPLDARPSAATRGSRSGVGGSLAPISSLSGDTGGCA